MKPGGALRRFVTITSTKRASATESSYPHKGACCCKRRHCAKWRRRCLQLSRGSKAGVGVCMFRHWRTLSNRDDRWRYRYTQSCVKYHRVSQMKNERDKYPQFLNKQSKSKESKKKKDSSISKKKRKKEKNGGITLVGVHIFSGTFDATEHEGLDAGGD